MESMQSLLQRTKMISGQECQPRTSPSSSNSPTTENTGADYWSWYEADGNPVRLSNEAQGIYVVETEMGKYLAMSEERFLASSPDVRTYPMYFETRTFDRFAVAMYGSERQKAQAALDISKKYVQGIDTIISSYGGGGLYYYSREKGTGKTYLSTIVGNELTKKGKRVRWYSVTNLLQEIKAGFDRESGTSSAGIIDTCKQTEILILDDIGVEKQSSWVNETMYSILDARMTNCRPTIFTSNVRPRELAYDERVLDRISRMSELVEMPEENVRRKLNAKTKLGDFLKGE